MAVLFDAKGTSDATSGAAVQTFTFNNLTIGTGQNRALVVMLHFALKTVTGITCTWNGVSMAAITNASGSDSGTNGFVQLFGLVNPASGNQSLVVNWTGLTQLTVDAISFVGVDQTGGNTTFPNGTSAIGTSTTSLIAVTSALDHMVVAAYSNPNNGFTSVNNNQIFIDNTPALIDCAANYSAGASSVTMAAIMSASSSWVGVATDILPDALSSQIWM